MFDPLWPLSRHNNLFALTGGTKPKAKDIKPERNAKRRLWWEAKSRTKRMNKWEGTKPITAFVKAEPRQTHSFTVGDHDAFYEDIDEAFLFAH